MNISTSIVKRLPLGKFGRRVFLVAGGTAIGQGLVLLVSPLLTRLYSPSDFGLFAVYASILGIVSVATSLRYEWAIPLPLEDDDALDVAKLCGYLLVTCVGCISIGCIFWSGNIATLVGKPDFAPYLWLVPVAAFAVGLYQIGTMWAIRKQEFAQLSTSKIIQGFTSAAAQVGFGFMGIGAAGMLTGDFIGRCMGAVNLVRSIVTKSRKGSKSSRAGSILALAARYRRFPMISTVSSLANSGGLQLPPLMLATEYGTAVAGAFALVQRVISGPTGLVTQVVSQVYLGELTFVMRNDRVAASKLFLRITIRLLPIGMIAGLIIALASPWVFTRIFGNEWALAGTFARAMGFLVMADVMASPLSMTLVASERQLWQLIWDIIRLFAVCIVFFGASIAGLTPAGAFEIYVASMIGCYSVLWILCFVALRSAK